jgi:hypothetical protein
MEDQAMAITLLGLPAAAAAATLAVAQALVVLVAVDHLIWAQPRMLQPSPESSQYLLNRAIQIMLLVLA